MAPPRPGWSDFGWQGLRLRVPDDWNLGRVEGDRRSGYARLDDPEIVRVELEWRTANARVREPVETLVDRYLASLEKKATKSGVRFSAQRRARFLSDRRWLEGSEHELFTWEADFRAHNLALRSGAGRIVLLRLLSRLDERPSPAVETVCRSLQDLSAEAEWPWSVYGMTFTVPAELTLESHKLRSGHIQLSFERGKEICRVQRLSLAAMLLKGAALADWYPVFCRQDLRDLVVELLPGEVSGHAALQVAGRPRSRWRQLLRPLPWLNPRPRLRLDGRVWQCPASDKICIVDHLFRREEEQGDLAQRIADGYVCHEQKAEAEPRGDAQLPAHAE